MDSILQSRSGSPMQPCELRSIVDQRGRTPIVEFRAQRSPAGRANLDRTLEQLRFQPFERWDKPLAARLKDHVRVIRFRDENRTQWRIFGYIAVPNHCFVMTLTGTERDGKYSPPDYEQRVAEARAAIGGNLLDRTAPWPSRW